MVARRVAVALAAVVGVSLQGCLETISELSCAFHFGTQVAEPQQKLMIVLNKKCKEVTEDGNLAELFQKCLDDGAEQIKEDTEAAGEIVTADCVEKIHGRDIKNIGWQAHDLILNSSSLFNLTETVNKHINETAQRIHDEAKEALDAVKDGANGAIGGARGELDEVTDGVNDKIDGAHGHNDDVQDGIEADTVQDGIEGERLFSMVRLPGTTAGSSTVACLSGAALLAAAGLVVVVRRASRQAAAEQSTPILACDEEL